MSKGVVVHLDGKAQILKTNGAFITCPRNPNWQLGDVVVTPRLIPLWSIIASGVIFLSLVIGTIVLYQIPATYLEVSVNPSVRLTFNRFGRVLRAEGLNAYGDNILQGGGAYKNLSLYEATARLFNSLENNGYLNKAEIRVIIANNSQKAIDSIEDVVSEVMARYNGSNMQTAVTRYAKDEYLSLTEGLQPIAPPTEPEPPAATPVPEIVMPGMRHHGRMRHNSW